LDKDYQFYYGQIVDVLELKPFMYDGVKETLEYLKQNGKTLAVLSGHPKKFLERELKQYGIIDYFSYIEGGCRNKTESLKNMCSLMGHEKENSVYVADSIHDVRHADEAGIKIIAVSDGYSRKIIHKKNMVERGKDYTLIDNVSCIMTSDSIKV